MTTDNQATSRRWAPAYRAHCPTCQRSGREFSSYGNAEEAARGHAGKHSHTAYVLDQYGIRVVGSVQKPGSEAGP